MKYMLEPVHDVIIVQPLTKQAESRGLIVSTSDEQEPDKGTVLAIGPGRYTEQGQFIPTTVKVGDVVMYPRGSGGYVKVNEDLEKVLVLPETNIIGILREVP